jgi:hypothetical protein
MMGLAVLSGRSDRMALLPREIELWTDSLKDSFNCRHAGRDSVRSVFVRGERRENIALWGRGRYIGG